MFPGQVPKELAHECIGLNIGTLLCREFLTSSDRNVKNDDSGEDSMPLLLCRESLLSSDEEEYPEGYLASMPSLHNIFISSGSDSAEDNDSSGDDRAPPMAPIGRVIAP
jgi:hypothetical protein